MVRSTNISFTSQVQMDVRPFMSGRTAQESFLALRSKQSASTFQAVSHEPGHVRILEPVMIVDPNAPQRARVGTRNRLVARASLLFAATSFKSCSGMFALLVLKPTNLMF